LLLLRSHGTGSTEVWQRVERNRVQEVIQRRATLLLAEAEMNEWWKMRQQSLAVPGSDDAGLGDDCQR
jgi:hypothetical protein